MKVKDVMRTRRLVSVRADDDLIVAVEMMRWAEVRHLPVLDGRRVVGILTEHDLLRERAEAGAREPAGVVAGVMSRPPEVVGPEDEVAAACAQMVARKIGCLPVVDETGALVGIVTKSDLLGRQMTTELAGATPSAARVSLAMRRDPASVPVRAPLLEAVAIMVDRDVRHVVVTDDERHVLGIVSDRDVRTAIGDPLEALHQELTEVDEMKVADVMTTDVVTVPERKPLEEVARLFMDGRIGAVPVVDDGRRLVGIVSYVDVLRALLAPDGR